MMESMGDVFLAIMLAMAPMIVIATVVFVFVFLRRHGEREEEVEDGLESERQWGIRPSNTAK
jgi:hypothetical protein